MMVNDLREILKFCKAGTRIEVTMDKVELVTDDVPCCNTTLCQTRSEVKESDQVGLLEVDLQPHLPQV